MNGNQYSNERYQNYLLVEGNDDKHVLLHLLEHHRLFEQFKIKDEQLQIQALEGLNNLLDAKTLRSYFKVSKALIHTWLAWQEKPGRPLGLAITARYFDATASYAQ